MRRLIAHSLLLSTSLASTLAFCQSLDLEFSCGDITSGLVTTVTAANQTFHNCKIGYYNASDAYLNNVVFQVAFDKVTQNFNLAPALPDGVPLLANSHSQTWQLAKMATEVAGSPHPLFYIDEQTIQLAVGDVPEQSSGEVFFRLHTNSHFPAGDSGAEILARVDGIDDNSIQHTMRWEGTGNFIRVAPIPFAQTGRKYIGSAYLEVQGAHANTETDVSLRVYLPYWDGVSFRSDDQFDLASGHIPVITSHQVEGRLALVNAYDAPEYVQDLPPGAPIDVNGNRSAPTTGDNANSIIWYNPDENTLRANPGVWWSAESLGSSPVNGHGRWRLRWQGEFNSALQDDAIAFGNTLPVEACVQSRESGSVLQGDPEFCVTSSTTITGNETIGLETAHTVCPSSTIPTDPCHDEAMPFFPGSAGRTKLYFNNDTSLSGDGLLYAQLPGEHDHGRLGTLTRFTVGAGLNVPYGNAATGAFAADDILLFVSTSPADYTGEVTDDVLTRDLPSAGTTWEQCPTIIMVNQGVRCDLAGLTRPAADITQVRVDVPGMRPHHQSLVESRNAPFWVAELQWDLSLNVPQSIDGLGSDTSTANRSFGVKTAFSLLTYDGEEGVFDAQTAEVSHTMTVTPSAGQGGAIHPSVKQEVEYTTTTQFSLIPDTGYHVSSVAGTCGGSLIGGTYTTNPVITNCSVVAFYAKNPVSDHMFADGFEKMH